MNLPLRARLTFVYSAIFIASIAVVELGVYWGVSSAFDSILDQELIARRAVVEEYIHNHVLRLSWPDLATALSQHRGFQPEWIEVRELSGETLFSGKQLREALQQPTTASARILRETRRIQGHPYQFTIGMDSGISSAVLDRLRMLTLLSSPLILLLASAAGYWIAGRALRPVNEIIRATHSIGVSNLGTRIDVPRSRDEIQRLAETVNSMLSRIESGFRQISQFTANASHELRTPLAIIRSTAEVALMHPDSGKGPERRALERILRQAERNSELLDDMLRLARLDSGADQLRYDAVDLNQSLDEAVRSMKPLFEARSLHLEFAATDCSIHGDAGHLNRLWHILLENAAKYTPPGGTVQVSLQVDSGGQPVCRFTDSGIGIEPSDLPHIFDRFYRADQARGSSGTGLGLSLAKQIADAHHASIEVCPNPSGGTIFSLRFSPSAILTKTSGNSQVHLISLK